MVSAGGGRECYLKAKSGHSASWELQHRYNFTVKITMLTESNPQIQRHRCARCVRMLRVLLVYAHRTDVCFTSMSILQAHIQGAILAGGVAMAFVISVNHMPWVAITTGMCAGLLSTLGLLYLKVL